MSESFPSPQENPGLLLRATLEAGIRPPELRLGQSVFAENPHLAPLCAGRASLINAKGGYALDITRTTPHGERVVHISRPFGESVTNGGQVESFYLLGTQIGGEGSADLGCTVIKVIHDDEVPRNSNLSVAEAQRAENVGFVWPDAEGNVHVFSPIPHASGDQPALTFMPADPEAANRLLQYLPEMTQALNEPTHPISTL